MDLLQKQDSLLILELLAPRCYGPYIYRKVGPWGALDALIKRNCDIVWKKTAGGSILLYDVASKVNDLWMA